MSAYPQITGVHHIGITVTDLDTSVTWYTRVLGARELRRLDRRLDIGPMTKALVQLGPVTLGLVSHGRTAAPGPFDEHRAGLDHLSLAVPDTAVLRAWEARLGSAGVENSGIVRGATGALIAFRDPDNIALEFYTLS